MWIDNKFGGITVCHYTLKLATKYYVTMISSNSSWPQTSTYKSFWCVNQHKNI